MTQRTKKRAKCKSCHRQGMGATQIDDEGFLYRKCRYCNTKVPEYPSSLEDMVARVGGW